jgi:hypothetical protein
MLSDGGCKDLGLGKVDASKPCEYGLTMRMWTVSWSTGALRAIDHLGRPLLCVR